MRQLKYTKPDPSELQLHKVVAELLDWCLLLPAVWSTFPAGWGHLSKTMAGNLQACGLKPGMPDIFVFHKATAIGIELKRPGGHLTAVQKEMREKLHQAGIAVFVCNSPEHVLQVLKMLHMPLRLPRPESTIKVA